MTADELRADPYAWTFARQHRQMQPAIARSRRRRRGLQLFVGAALVAGLSLFGASMLSAGPPAAVGIGETGSGGFEITVQPGAGSDEIVADLRAAFEERGVGVKLETISGRDLVVGRVIGDGPGVSMVDSDPAMDYTATRVLFDAGAAGLVSVVVGSDTRWNLYVSEPTCAAFGRPVTEVRGELEARGFEVTVTPMVRDQANGGEAFAVRDVTSIADRVNLIVQPLTELNSAHQDCG